MREKVGSARSLGDMEVKKSFWNWREKAAPWKELVTTAEACRNRPKTPGGRRQRPARPPRRSSAGPPRAARWANRCAPTGPKA